MYKRQESISDLEEEIEVLDMFKNENEVPKESPIGSKDKEQIKIQISKLEDQKNNIQAEIEKLLRKQASS